MRLSEIATILEAECTNLVDVEIVKFSSLKNAEYNHLAFASTKNLKSDHDTKAGALLVTELPSDLNKDICYLCVKNLDFARSQAIKLIHPVTSCSGKFHPSAIINSSASVHSTCDIGAGVFIDDDVKIGNNTRIGANVVIEKNAKIGNDCTIAANAVIGWNCIIGSKVNIDSGVVIGSSGFGLALQNNEWHEIPQIGKVIIEDKVLIGSNCSIDRGAIDDTIIREGVKMDNLIHIAHNVEIGRNTVIAGHSAIAGSAKLGENCVVLGCCGIAAHTVLADNTHINSMSGVNSNLKSGSYTGMFPLQPTSKWRKNAAIMRNIDTILAKIKSKL